MNKRILIGIFLAFVIVLSSNFFSGYLSSNAQTTQFSISSIFGGTASNSVCQSGQDFLIQISPFGCTPAPVRSDLLEENDVPVYCQLGVTQINPLINVNSIDSISFSGKYSPQVSGISFYPAKAALGIQGDLNSPILNNIGYVVITLKKQANESSMPDFVSGNLSAKVSYNANNAFGIGNAQLTLPEFASDSDWQDAKNSYGFWNGKGYLKADNINKDGADISVYTDSGKVSSASLKTGETSKSIYLPGFECKAGLKLKLESLENPDTKARLTINADVVELAKGEKFLDNKCQILDWKNNGIVSGVTIKCSDDYGTNTASLGISPKIVLNIEGTEQEYSLGDRLFSLEGNSIYLGYAGTKKNSGNSNDLIVYFFSQPAQQDKKKLSDSELASISSLVGDSVNSNANSGDIFSKVNDALNSAGSFFTQAGGYVLTGNNLQGFEKSDAAQSVFGKSIIIKGLAGASDRELTGDSLTEYNNAKSDYETIISQFASESFSSAASTTYGEEALYNEITLAHDANQKKTLSDLCKQFISDYPSSAKNTNSYCSELQVSNQDASGIYVTINKQIKKISFEGIYEPSFEEYGAVITASSSSGVRDLNLKKNRIAYLDSSTNDYVQLISLDDNSATVQISVTTDKTASTNTAKLMLGVPNNFDKAHSFTLQKINLKKNAKVSVQSNIDSTGTQANFSFKIGIEKRAINLSPSQISQTIKDLDASINGWKSVSSFLNSTNTVLKAGCLATGAALVATNFLLGIGGIGSARQQVMQGAGGWDEFCANEVSLKHYISLDACFLDKADKIDADVDYLSNLMKQQNSNIKEIENENGVSTTSVLGEKVVNNKKFVEKYSPQVLSDIPDTVTSSDGKTITKSEMTDILSSSSYNNQVYTIEQLKEIELYSNALKDSTATEEMKNIAKQRLYSDLLNVKTNAGNYLNLQKSSKATGVDASKMTSLTLNANTKAIPYYGLKNSDLTAKISAISEDTPVALVQLLPSGLTYIVALADSGNSIFSIKFTNTDGNKLYFIYDSSGYPVSDSNILNQFNNIYFQKYDSTTYTNQYKNAKLSCYETEPYKGMPAVVPFDKTNGWYALITQTISAGSSLSSYQANGKVSSFWVCNVGKNGLEENKGGDDICEMINTGTGQSYKSFNGLSETDAANLINKANQAIEQASSACTSGASGKVKILNDMIDVGTPATDVPDIQCQDFMSPTECAIVFNLCDPVICPSSRCDLGGTYPVKDVVQTGAIGSIALCLPNSILNGGDMILPVCLTGVQAGVDGFLSTLSDYKKCLNESLTTGKTVGICDELNSVYICNFIWNQALPLANMIIPTFVQTISGQNVKGGGEYLSIASAWSNAEKAINYFISSYGAESKTAFTARSTETVQNEVCKVYASAVVPSGGDFINNLLASDSPPQFTGRFEEITLTTATNPSTSQYKVYYHIYAGKDSGVYYQIYLKGVPESSYYKDTAQTVTIDSGYISVGGSEDQTKDIIATSGYKQLCINVNGQEECGFNSVSTSFLSNYVADAYVASQANEAQITKTSDCISGTASIYSALNLNVQSAAESIINPAIYNEGIIRICATADPGKGTDAYSGTEKARWKEVGYCDSTNIKCWIDTESIKEVIKSTAIENSTLSSLTTSYSNILTNENGYLTTEQFNSNITNIKNEKELSKKVSLINEVIEKVYLSNQKVQLLFLRGSAYNELLNVKRNYFRLTNSGCETISLFLSETTSSDFDTMESCQSARTKGTTSASSSTGGTSTPSSSSSQVTGKSIWLAAENIVATGVDEIKDARFCSDLTRNYYYLCRYDNVCVLFVSHAMSNAGIKLEGTLNYLPKTSNDFSVNKGLIPFLSKDTDFKEISSPWTNNLQQGDIIILSCKDKIPGTDSQCPTDSNGNSIGQHTGIFDSYVVGGIKIYSDQGAPYWFLGIFETDLNTPKLSNYAFSKGWEIYRVYRYSPSSSP
ncbi:Uncharacterised protein [uncultured archaeon]|nr:Uncharacterised protein [uncultured archaeon]